jgi:hypothetical protein
MKNSDLVIFGILAFLGYRLYKNKTAVQTTGVVVPVVPSTPVQTIAPVVPVTTQPVFQLTPVPVIQVPLTTVPVEPMVSSDQPTQSTILPLATNSPQGSDINIQTGKESAVYGFPTHMGSTGNMPYVI